VLPAGTLSRCARRRRWNRSGDAPRGPGGRVTALLERSRTKPCGGRPSVSLPRGESGTRPPSPGDSSTETMRRCASTFSIRLFERPFDAPERSRREWIDARIRSASRDDTAAGRGRAVGFECSGARDGSAPAGGLLARGRRRAARSALVSAKRRPNPELIRRASSTPAYPELSFEAREAIAAIGIRPFRAGGPCSTARRSRAQALARARSDESDPRAPWEPS